MFPSKKMGLVDHMLDHILNHMLDQMLDHMIIGFMTIALQRSNISLG